jgi:chromatin remodeling complex protein RSC6
MADLLEKQIDAALEKGRAVRETEPRADSAYFDKKSGRIVIRLTNGAEFSFPPGLVEGLADASTDKLSDIEVLGRGHALHWESLDLDFSVPNLLNGIFSTSRWMASRAGAATSERKAAAARANGAKGGRPRNVQPSPELAPITGRAPLPRSQVVSKVWDHIKKNNLRDPKNKREIMADATLKPIFGGKDRISMFEMNTQLSKHYKDIAADRSSLKISPKNRGSIGRKRA